MPDPWQIVGVGDFTKDGHPDLLWRNATTGEVYVWVMDGVTHTGDQSIGYVPDPWQFVGLGEFGYVHGVVLPVATVEQYYR